jgi:hypothetical protein
MLEDRIVWEHRAWHRIRATIERVLKKHPDVAKELAEELAREEAGTA